MILLDPLHGVNRGSPCALVMDTKHLLGVKLMEGIGEQDDTGN